MCRLPLCPQTGQPLIPAAHSGPSELLPAWARPCLPSFWPPCPERHGSTSPSALPPWAPVVCSSRCRTRSPRDSDHGGPQFSDQTGRRILAALHWQGQATCDLATLGALVQLPVIGEGLPQYKGQVSPTPSTRSSHYPPTVYQPNLSRELRWHSLLHSRNSLGAHIFQPFHALCALHPCPTRVHSRRAQSACHSFFLCSLCRVSWAG
jgi:hypothetical protein